MVKKVKRGIFGNINTTGDAGAAACNLHPSSKNFWEGIEPGIKPLVVAILERGHDTMSSCEGHIYSDGQREQRAVSILVEMFAVKDWSSVVEEVSRKYSLELRCFSHRSPGAGSVARWTYLDPCVFTIILGFPDDPDLKKKTTLLTALFRRGVFPPVQASA